MDSKEKANDLINKFGKDLAKLCVKEILDDLYESLEVAKDLHPHAEGLIAGSITIWQNVNKELK